MEEAAGDSSRLVGEGILAGEEERSPRRKPVVDEVSAAALDEDEDYEGGAGCERFISFIQAPEECDACVPGEVVADSHTVVDHRRSTVGWTLCVVGSADRGLDGVAPVMR